METGKRSIKIRFTVLNEDELQTTYGGKSTVRIYYDENGNKKWEIETR